MKNEMNHIYMYLKQWKNFYSQFKPTCWLISKLCKHDQCKKINDNRVTLCGITKYRCITERENKRRNDPKTRYLTKIMVGAANICPLLWEWKGLNYFCLLICTRGRVLVFFVILMKFYTTNFGWHTVYTQHEIMFLMRVL